MAEHDIRVCITRQDLITPTSYLRIDGEILKSAHDKLAWMEEPILRWTQWISGKVLDGDATRHLRQDRPGCIEETQV